MGDAQLKKPTDVNGGTTQGLGKSTDPYPGYHANENVPRDDFHSSPLAEDFENKGSFAKRFVP